MKLREYLLNEKSGGSYLDNQKLPKEGDVVYVMTSRLGIGNPKKGIVKNITNIDNRGLSNTYLDIDVNGSLRHVNLMLVYDHKPKQVTKKDEFGEIKTWV